MKNRSMIFLAAVLTIVSYATFWAQSPLLTNSGTLAQFPSIERVRTATKGTDDVDTHARFMAALWRINDMIKEDLRKASNGGYYDMPPAAQNVQYRYSGAITRYSIDEVPPAGRDPRFRPLEEKYEKDPVFFDGLLTQFFSPEFRIGYYAWVRKPVPQQTAASGAPPSNTQPDSSASSNAADAIAIGRALAGPQLWADEARKLHAANNEAGPLAKFDSAIAKYKEIIANYPASRFPGVTTAYIGLGKIYMIDLRRYDLRSALPVWQALRKLQPNEATNAVLVGQALYQLKRNDEALQAFNDGLSLKPKPDIAVVVHLAIGYIYKDKAQYDRAVFEYQEVLRIAPADSGAYHALGIAYYNLKDHPKAIDAFQQAIKLKYTPVEQSYNWIGYIYNELGQSDKAVPVLQSALAIKPDYANTHGNLGLAYIGLKRYPEAVAELQQAIRLDPSNSQTRYNLGFAYVKMGKKAEATAVYNQLLTMDKAKATELYTLINNPTAQAANNGNKTPATSTATPAVTSNALDHLNKGNQFFNDRDFDKAIAEYQAIIALKPEKKIMLEAYQGLAASYEFLSDLNKAISIYLQTNILDPSNPSGFWILGERYFQTLQYAKAAAAFKEAMRLKPTETHYYSELGDAYMVLGKKAEAMQVYDSLLGIDKDAAKNLLERINDPGGPTAILAFRSEVLLLGDRDRDLATALVYLRAALNIKPANTYGLLKVGEAYSLWDHHDEAIAAYRRVIALKPKPETLAEAFGGIGQAYSAQKQYAKAIPEFKESLRIKPDEYMTRELGHCYFNLKDYANALAVYQQAVQLKPDSAEPYFVTGMTYAAMNQFDKAIAAYNEAARLEPKSGRGFTAIGKIYFQLKKYPDAGRAFSAALRIDPKDKAALFGIGTTFVAIGRKPDAMRAYTALKPLDEKLAQQLLDEINKR